MDVNTQFSIEDDVTSVYLEVAGDGSGRRAAASPRRSVAGRTALRPLSACWTRAGLSQRDNLYQQLRDAPGRRGRTDTQADGLSSGMMALWA